MQLGFTVKDTSEESWFFLCLGTLTHPSISCHWAASSVPWLGLQLLWHGGWAEDMLQGLMGKGLEMGRAVC